MQKYVIFGAALAGLLLSTTAEARRHHSRHATTRCAPGDLYRPSIRACESRGAHRLTMKDAAKFERVSKRDLRRMSRRERRAYEREMAAAEERAEREAARPRRLLSTNKYVGPTVVTENEDEVRAQEAAMAMVPPEAPVVAQKRVQTASADVETTMVPVAAQPAQAASQEKYVPLISGPFKIAAPLSLNPRPRFTSRFDWSPAVAGAAEWP